MPSIPSHAPRWMPCFSGIASSNEGDRMKVSIIMPAFMAADWIERAIRSVIVQSYEDWELIIVDDGSHDDTGIIARAHISREQRIRYYYQPNGGTSSARNV